MVPVGVLGVLLCVQLCRGTGEVRLVDGGDRCAGRVEIKHEGEWGSVCIYDFYWDAHWATVVCWQLGCGQVVKASPYALFGQGTGRIWIQPFCRGSEVTLQDCPHLGWGQHYCDHKSDVGVICAEAVELRLVAGASPCAGRVEAKLQGHWGVVADINWDMEDAEVVCQQLGCGSAAGAYPATTHFGKGDGPLNLVLIDCRGDEAALWECEIHGWGPYNGIHDFDTAVVCQGFARLIGGDSACAGRLEVRRGQEWASICEEHMDIKATQVVCRELGCGVALAVSGSSQFEAGTGLFWEEGFECTGTEPLLSACARRLPQGLGCTGHSSVICSPYMGFQLADNSSGCAGRVEAEVGGTWGSLCATGWDLPDAHVLCHYLGCGHAATVLPGGSFGGGNGPLWRDAFSCSGSERHPGECPTVVLGEPACPPGHTASVNCSGVTVSVRLVEGQSRCDGRLEVTTSPGAWARVAAGSWDAQSAIVACRQLGCGVPEKVYAVPGSGSTRLQRLRCAGSKENAAQCNVSGTVAVPSGSPEEVAVVCSGSHQVRLVGGPWRCAGQVEVYVNGTWATVCQDSWGLPDAAIVCHQLGCGMALEAPGLARFSAGTGLLWPHAGGCAGTEASLWDCPALVQHGCQSGLRAGAVCSEQLSLRLVGSSSRCSGHLEVLYNGTWGRVCANGTSPATAAAVCWQLGCGAGGSLVAATARHPLPSWLAWVGCEEGTRSLWRCPSAPWRLQACSPGGDTHVTCDDDSDGGTSGTRSPSPGSCSTDGATCTGVPSSTAAAVGTMPVPMVLCVVLGTLLCLAVGALTVQVCRTRARCRGPGRAADALSDTVYEELDYTLAPEYQAVPSHSGSPSEGSWTNLPCYISDGVEEGDAKAAPDSPALPEDGPPDGYDNAAAVPEECPTAGTGDISEGMAQTIRGRVPPSGGSCCPPSPPGAMSDPPAQHPGNIDYDDVGSSTSGTSP